MSRPTFQSADLLRFIFLHWMLVACCCTADADDCLEVKTAYMMRQIGPVELVPNKPKIGEVLEVCGHAGPSCCNSRMEDSYMTAVRAETQQRIRSYSFELKYLLAGHSRAFQETFMSLASFTSNLTSSLLDSAYASLASDCRPLVARLFQDVELHLSGDADSSLELAVRRFYDDLFPLVYRRLLNPGIGHTTRRPHTSSARSSANQDECLRMTRQDVSPFGPHPRLLIGSLSRALEPGRALSRLLGLAGEVVNATDKVALGRECGRGLVRMQYCSHCRGLTLIRPCNGLCVNIMRGCLVGVSELGGPWTSSVLLLQRLAAMLAASSGPNTMELALLSVRSYVNDAILHAQLHGPRITATVEKVCGQQTHNAASAEPEFLTSGVKSTTSLTSSWAPSPGPETLQDAQPAPRRSVPLKGSRGDKLRSLKRLSREFEGSIQRYQWFFSELPEMLCESEIEVDQHTCWSGRDVVESYTGPVVDGSLKAQRENPEMAVRNTDAGLRGAKKRLEQLLQDLLGELGWASRGRGQQEEEEEDGSGQRETGSGEDCDDEDGCEGSAQENGEKEAGGQVWPSVRPPSSPRRPAPPQVSVLGDSSSISTAHLSPLTLTALLFISLLLSLREPL